MVWEGVVANALTAPTSMTDAWTTMGPEVLKKPIVEGYKAVTDG